MLCLLLSMFRAHLLLLIATLSLLRIANGPLLLLAVLLLAVPPLLLLHLRLLHLRLLHLGLLATLPLIRVIVLLHDTEAGNA